MTADEMSRRHLLRAGWVTVAAAAMAGCRSGSDPDPLVLPEPEAPTEGGQGPTDDVALLNTALSLEVLLVDTYQLAFDQALVASDEVVDALELFQGHHAEHRDALVALVEEAGGEPFTTPNPVVKAGLVDPTVLSITAERDFVRLAHELEQASTQLYVHAAAALGEPSLRATVMSVGAVASRRAAVLDLLGELGTERVAVYPSQNPLPSDAIVPS